MTLSTGQEQSKYNMSTMNNCWNEQWQETIHDNNNEQQIQITI